MWSDATPWDFDDWLVFQPANLFGQDCVQVFTTGEWDDVGCGADLPYVCKAPHS